MSIRPGIRRLFRLAIRRRALLRDDIDDEIRLHLELRAAELEREGLSPAEARREAERRFGRLDEATRVLRLSASQREDRMHFRELFDAASQDLQQALRMLRRERAFAAFVIVTLALGIGANAAMFGVVDRLLLRGPEHVTDPERVQRVYETESPPGIGETTSNSFGYATYAYLARVPHVFDGVAAYSVNDAAIGRGEAAQQVKAGYATSGFFPLLGVHPIAGRFFGADEDRTTGAEHVVVLGYALWQRDYGGERAALGRTLVVGDEPYTIVGVAPPAFTGAELERVDLWMPMSILGARVTKDWTTTWFAQWLRVIVRLRAGVTTDQASADATAAHRLAYDGPEKSEREARIFVAPLASNSQGQPSTEAAVSRWLVGVAAIVLLIACANVANLLLARAVRRRREVAVRLALGAGRGRLVRMLLIESTVLATNGGILGLFVANWTGRAIRAALLPNVEWSTAPVSGRVLAFSALVIVVTSALIGLVPALQASRPDLTAALKLGAREGGYQRSRLRGALTVAQAALSVVLLVGAGLFIRSLTNVRALDLGFRPDRVLSVGISWPAMRRFPDGPARDAERARRKAFYSHALDEVRALAGVEQASLAIGTPLLTTFSQGLRADGVDSIPRLAGGGPYLSAVTSGYFASVGTPLLRGRVFTAADREGSERVAVVSQTMVRTIWPAGDAIGRCLYIDAEPCARVVGVVGDAHRFKLREPPAMHYYVPLGQEEGIGGTDLLVRPRGAVLEMVPTIRRALQSLDPDLGYVDIRTLQSRIDPQVRPWRLGAMVFGIFGVLALVVAAIGLYSVIAYVVAQRTREIGIRIALGARSREIVMLIVTQGVGSALLGVAIGIALALFGGRYIANLLFDTNPRDAMVFAAVTGVLLAVALAASLVPAWRAKRVDPVVALRAD